MIRFFALVYAAWLRYKRDQAYSMMFRRSPHALRYNGRRRDD